MNAPEHRCATCGISMDPRNTLCTSCGSRQPTSATGSGFVGDVSSAPPAHGTAPTMPAPTLRPPAPAPPVHPAAVPPAVSTPAHPAVGSVPGQPPALPSPSPSGAGRPWMLGAALGVVLLLVVGILVGRLTSGEDADQAARPDTAGAAVPAADTDDGSGEPADVQSDDPTSPNVPPQPDLPSEPARPDPLRLGSDFVNQGCNGGYVVMLASSGDPRAYRRTLRPALARVAGGRYLVTNRSCRAFVQEVGGNAIYGAYMGPFPNLGAACRARGGAVSFGDSYVRQLVRSKLERDLCSCLRPASTLPLLMQARDSTPVPVRQFAVVDMQALLYRAGFNPAVDISGSFGPATRRGVLRFQASEGLSRTGAVDDATWSRLQAGC